MTAAPSNPAAAHRSVDGMSDEPTETRLSPVAVANILSRAIAALPAPECFGCGRNAHRCHCLDSDPYADLEAQS
jgi:hypothetical protein